MHLMYTLDPNGNRYVIIISYANLGRRTNFTPLLQDLHPEGEDQSSAWKKEHMILELQWLTVLNSLIRLQKSTKDGKVTKSAHPARFSPDDKFSRHRVTIKKRWVGNQCLTSVHIFLTASH